MPIASDLHPDEDTMVRVAADRLSAKFPAANTDFVEQRVREIVHDLCEHARVKKYVGVIAERRAQDEIRERISA